MNNWREETNEQISEWSGAFVPITRFSRPACSGKKPSAKCQMELKVEAYTGMEMEKEMDGVALQRSGKKS